MNKTILIPFAKTRVDYGAILSLGREGYRVIAAILEKDTTLPLAQSKYVRRVITCPNPENDLGGFSEWLQGYMEANPEHYVLPINETVVFAASELRKNVSIEGRVILPSDEHLFYSLSKYHSNQAAECAGVYKPKTTYLRQPGEVEYTHKSHDYDYPCIVKWDNCATVKGYAKGDNRVVRSETELLEVLAELEDRHCGVIAQEFVPGRGVGAFFLRRNGKILLSFAHRREHELPWTGGVSTMCSMSTDEEVLSLGEEFLEEIDYDGVAMVEFRQAEGGKPYFIEVNGRLWGSLGLSRSAGVDFPRALVDTHIHGETQVSQPDLAGKALRWRHFFFELEHIRSVFKTEKSVEGRPSRLKSLLSLTWHTLSPGTKSDFIHFDDLKPGVLTCWRGFRAEAARLKKRINDTRSGKKQKELELQQKFSSHSSKALEGFSKSTVKNVLFICYGNICRSSYAEFRWNEWRDTDDGFAPCVSAGFHINVNRQTPQRFQNAAKLRGVNLETHRSKVITNEMVDLADVVVVMDRRNWRDMESNYPQAMDKVICLGVCDDYTSPEIPDPYGEPIPAGAKTYARIDLALKNFAESIR